MAKLRLVSVLAALSALVGRGAHAFLSPRHSIVPAAPSVSLSLGMAPRFDPASQEWFATDPETEGPSAGYGPVGSLYRAGPLPFFQRIVNPKKYEQAVLKFMAQDGCDRAEAQGNMDAYIENPQDWAYQKMEEKRGMPKKDYANANMEPQQIILSTVWAVVVIGLAFIAIPNLASGRNVWDF